MKTLMTIALTGMLAWAAPLQDAENICYDCHKKAGTHLKDLSECKICGSMGGSCCTSLCCDTRVYVCAKCGRKSPANWPEGGKAVDGIQMSIKPVAKAFKVGEPVELVVKITNTGEAAWTRTNHAYSHGGFDVHTCWTAKAGGRSITNMSKVVYVCPQVEGHADQTATLTLAAGASIVYKVSASEGFVVQNSIRKPALISAEAGEITIQLTELTLNAASNELKVTIAK